jgi:glycosyltransferase involved in cell wall biosynthesis
MPANTAPVLAIVVPCYNEEEVLPDTAQRLSLLLAGLIRAGKISGSSQIYFVDDGSRDGTWRLISALASTHRQFCGIKLSRNRGHQNALIAGLFSARGDILVSVDADLQDDIEAIAEMIDKYRDGAEIVYGVRNARDTDTTFKRVTASAFYRLMRTLGAESVDNHADYRLMSRRAVECLREYPEVNLYLRGIVPLIGFKSAIVYYDRGKRVAGTSKYPLRKMLGLALDAITSFSVIPLRLVTLLGFTVAAGSMVVALWALWVKFVADDAVPGWTSVVLPMYFLGGVQILCLGIFGEYLGKVYSEVKARPRYFIEAIVAGDEVWSGSEPSRLVGSSAARTPEHALPVDEAVCEPVVPQQYDPDRNGFRRQRR